METNDCSDHLKNVIRNHQPYVSSADRNRNDDCDEDDEDGWVVCNNNNNATRHPMLSNDSKIINYYNELNINNYYYPIVDDDWKYQHRVYRKYEDSPNFSIIIGPVQTDYGDEILTCDDADADADDFHDDRENRSADEAHPNGECTTGNKQDDSSRRGKEQKIEDVASGNHEEDDDDDDLSNDSHIVFYKPFTYHEKWNFERRQLISNVVYFDTKENIWKTQQRASSPPPRYNQMTAPVVDLDTNGTAITQSLSSQPCTSAKMTYEELIQRRRYTENTIGQNNNTILLLAIQEDATDVAIDIIRIEYDTFRYYSVHYADRLIGTLRDYTILETANTMGLTPLNLAAQRGNIPIVQELLRCGVSMSYSPPKNYTGSAIMQAAHYGQTKVIEWFIQYYSRQKDPTESLAEVLDNSNANMTTPLMRAAQEGQLSVVALLLEHDASVNVQNRNGMTPLMLAAQRGHVEICRKLIEYGANLDIQTEKKRSTALMLTCRRGHLAVIKELVTSGCELQLKNTERQTAQNVIQHRMERRQAPLQANRRLGRHDRNEVVQLEPNGENDINAISSHVDERILLLLNPQTQVQLIQFSLRVKRNFEIIRIHTLFHHNRANIKLKDGSIIDVSSAVQWLTMMEESTNHSDSTMTTSKLLEQPHAPQKEVQHDDTHSCIQILIRSVMLPTPLVKAISLFLPLPNLWEGRMEKLRTNRFIDEGVKIVYALDIIDEILEEAGFLLACDQALIPAPIPCPTWCDWKRHARARATWSDGDDDPSFRHITPRQHVDVTASLPPSPRDKNNPTICELRRLVSYTCLLAQYQSQTDIVTILMAEPYHMPRPLISKLIRIADISSICRRCCIEECLPTSLGSTGNYDISFSPRVASDMVDLTRTLLSWYNQQNN